MAEKTPIIDMFSDVPVDTSVMECRHVPIYPTMKGIAPCTLRIETGGGFLDMNRSFFRIKLKLKSGANADIAENCQAMLTPGYIHAMIKELQVQWNTTTVDSTNDYGYRAFMQKILYDDPTVTEHSKFEEGWTNDIDLPAVMVDNAGTVPTHANVKALPAEQQLGIAAALDALAPHYAGREIVYHVKLKSPIFDLDRPIGPGQQLTFEIWFKDAIFWGINEPAGTATAANQLRNIRDEDIDVSFNACFLKLNDSVQKSILKERMKGRPYRYPVKYWKIRKLYYERNKTWLQEAALFGNNKPNRVFVAFVNKLAVDGSWTRPPFSFERIDIKNLRLSVNGQLYPWDELDLKNQTGENDKVGYYRFKDSVGAIPSERAQMVKPGMWGHTYRRQASGGGTRLSAATKVTGCKTIFGIDLTGNGLADAPMKQPVIGGDVKLEFTTTADNGNDFIVFVYGEFESSYVVKANGVVSADALY